MPHEKLTDTVITLQAVMREVLRSDGGKDFKFSHLKKQTHRRKGEEIKWVPCDQNTIDNA